MVQNYLTLDDLKCMVSVSTLTLTSTSSSLERISSIFEVVIFNNKSFLNFLKKAAEFFEFLGIDVVIFGFLLVAAYSLQEISQISMCFFGSKSFTSDCFHYYYYSVEVLRRAALFKIWRLLCWCHRTGCVWAEQRRLFLLRCYLHHLHWSICPSKCDHVALWWYIRV